MSEVKAVCHESRTSAAYVWIYTGIALFLVLYALFVVYLCARSVACGRIDLALITMISSINLPVLGPILVWIFYIAGKVPCKSALLSSVT
jgi:hypothetical protein